MEIKFTQLDIEAMVKTLYGEARGSTDEDRIAVAHVIVNRAKAALQYRIDYDKRSHPLFGDGTLASVCYAPYQFSCWNRNDPNHPVLLNLDISKDLAKKAFMTCMVAVLTVLLGRVKDPTKNSVYYHTKMMGWPLAWGKAQEPTVTIGAHCYYKDFNFKSF